MTDPLPTLLFDTCSIINLSYCRPVATIFRGRYEGRAGWVRAVQSELVRLRARQPPHPQAGRACSWAITWLGNSIEIVDQDLLITTEDVQRAIAVGSADSALDHLEKQQASHCSSRPRAVDSSATITPPEPNRGSGVSQRAPQLA